MRLMQVMAGARHGGAEAFFERLVPALARAGTRQCAVIRRHETRRRLLEDAGVEVVELPFGGRLDRQTPKALRRLTETWRPGILLSWMNRASRAAGRASPPYVHIGRLGGYYDLKYYRHCHHLIGNTEAIVRYIVDSGWPADRAHYLPNFVAAEDAAAVARASLDTPDEAPLLVALGRLHPNKGFDVLLRALETLDGYWLWLAGSGPQEAKLKQLARTLGVAERVRFLGWRHDVSALLRAADVLVCPSRHEPLGNVIIEGWAHKVPVVASAAAGPDGLIEHGVTGLKVPVEDAAALAGAVRAAIAEPARFAAAGRDAYQRGYCETVVVARYLQLFERLTRQCAA